MGLAVSLLALVRSVFHVDAERTVDSPPSIILPFIRILLSPITKFGWRKAFEQGLFVAPRLSLRVNNIGMNKRRLKEYCRVVQCEEDAASCETNVPSLYIQALLGSSLIDLASHPQNPAVVLGMVHVRNQIRQRRAIDVNETLSAVLSVMPKSVKRKRGTEMFMSMKVYSQNEPISPPVWECIWSGLVFHRTQPGDATERGREPSNATAANIWRLKVPTDVGRKFASITSDYNPIHVSTLLAKVMGFKMMIVHGLWLAAKVLYSSEGPLNSKKNARFPLILDVEFKRPVFMGSEVVAKQSGALRVTAQDANSDSTVSSDRTEVVIVDGHTQEKVHQHIDIETASAEADSRNQTSHAGSPGSI